ncbi:MAG: hypothetical protein RR942_16055 [Romboutsia sp.]
MNQNKRKRALGYSFATMLILFGVLGLICLSEYLSNEILGLIFFFLCLIPSTGIYVYLGCTYEEKSAKNFSKSKKIDAISSIIWLLSVSLFFIIGSIFNGWQYAWVIFLIGAATNILVELFDNEKKDYFD